MKRKALVLANIFAAIFLQFALISTTSAQVNSPATIYVRCGKLVYDVDKPPLSSAVVVISEGKITAVGVNITIPPGANQLDFSRYTVLPGLIDAHIHLTGPRDEGISDPLAILRAAQSMKFALSSGVVAARVLDSPGFIDVALKTAIDEGTTQGPHLVPGGHAISVPGGHGDDYELPQTIPLDDYYIPRNGFINSPADAEKAVHLQIKYGARVIKVLASGGIVSPADSPADHQLSQEELRVIVDQAHMRNLKVAAHAENRTSILASLRAGVDSIEHGSDLDDEAIKLMKDRGVFLVPTLHVFDPEGKDTTHLPDYVAAKRVAVVKTHFPSFRLATRSGVLIAAGSDTDYEPQWGTIVDEIFTEVKFGMTPQQALKSATSNGAALLGLDQLGSITVGKEGDMIAVEGDPLLDITALSKIRSVVFQGKLVPSMDTPRPNPMP